MFYYRIRWTPTAHVFSRDDKERKRELQILVLNNQLFWAPAYNLEFLEDRWWLWNDRPPIYKLCEGRDQFQLFLDHLPRIRHYAKYSTGITSSTPPNNHRGE